MGEVIGTGIGLLVIGLILYGLIDAARGMFRKRAPERALGLSTHQAPPRRLGRQQGPRHHLPGYDAGPDEVVEVVLEPLPDPERGALGGSEGVWARIMRLGAGSVQMELDAHPESIEDVSDDGPLYRKDAAIFPTAPGSAQPLIEALCARLGAPAPPDSGSPHEVDEGGDAELNAQVLCYGPSLDEAGRVWTLYGVTLEGVEPLHFRVDEQGQRAQWLLPELEPHERETMAAMIAMRLRGLTRDEAQHEGLPRWGARREALLRVDEVDDIDAIEVVIRGDQVFVGYAAADTGQDQLMTWSREGGARALLSLPEGMGLMGFDACARGELGVCLVMNDEEQTMLLWVDLRRGTIMQEVALPVVSGGYHCQVVMRPDGQQVALARADERADEDDGQDLCLEVFTRSGQALARSDARAWLRPSRWDEAGIWGCCEDQASFTSRLISWRPGEALQVYAPGVAYAPPEAPRTRYQQHQLVFERAGAPTTALPYTSADDYAWWSLTSDYEADVLPWLNAHTVVMDGLLVRLIDTRTGRAIAVVQEDEGDVVIHAAGDRLLVMERMPDDDEGDDVVLCVIVLDELAAGDAAHGARVPDGASW